MRDQLHGLYAITDSALAHNRSLPAMVAAALRGGARIIQYRDKTSNAGQRLAQAQQLRTLCTDHAALLIINDDVELALACAADGVHLGQTDTALPQARAQLGPQRIIGVSCHADLRLAHEAQQAGADYIALGRFYPSTTKPLAPPATLEVLRALRQQVALPIAAIGGITPHNAGVLIDAGAAMIAVIAGVFGAQDIEAAARSYAALFQPSY
ncbi:MAG: thiamine phosphate synthase [Gammaproteobacteria bacterium]|nr:thiamine phosphate synthase [Gammaproteobacteria bacterium]